MRVRVWIPRYGSNLMMGWVLKGEVVESESLGTRDPKVAEAEAWKYHAALLNAEAERKRKIDLGELGDIANQPLRIGALFRRYFGSNSFAKLSDRRKSEKRRMLERWESYLGSTRLLKTISEEDVRGYERQRREVVKQQTVYNEWSALRSVVNWALTGKLLTLNPLLGITVATERNPTQYVMPHAEYLSLRNKSRSTVPLVVRVYMSVVEGTGRRAMAVAQLRWEDIDLKGGWITWSEEVDKQGVRWHEVPIDRRVNRILRMWRRHSTATWVFESPRGEPYSKSAVDQWMRDLYDSAGLKKPYRSGCHSLRRKFATDMTNSGVPHKVAMELGGWKSTAAFQRYVQPDKNARREGLRSRKRACLTAA